MESNIVTALQAFNYVLSEYREGGLPFNLLIDNEYHKQTRMFIKPLPGSRSFEAFSIDKNDNVASHGETIPESYSEGVVIATERFEYGMKLIPEFRTILAYSENFYRRASASMGGYNIDNPITPRDWVRLILRLNAHTAILKSKSIRGMNNGKGKGLSRTELKFINETYVPIYVSLKPEESQYSTPFEDYITGEMFKAVTFMDNLVLSENIPLVQDPNVYFGGYSCNKTKTSTAVTCYTAKIDLLNKGYNTIPEFYSSLLRRIESMTDEEIKSIYDKVAVVWDLKVDEDTAEDYLSQ